MLTRQDPLLPNSTIGYCVFIGRNIISWKSNKQNVVSQSIAEVEKPGCSLHCFQSNTP